jgi:hypothetical protein
VSRSPRAAAVAALGLALGLVVPGGPTAGQGPGPEAAVASELDRVVALARAGELADLVTHLACPAGSTDGGVLRVRPCALPGDRVRAEAVLAHLRTTFGADTPYVIDWLQSFEEEGVVSHRIQVKVRRTEPPVPVEYRFVEHGDELLLADAGPELLTPHLEEAMAVRSAAAAAPGGGMAGAV